MSDIDGDASTDTPSEAEVSVAMEGIKPNEWVEKVYGPEVKNNLDKLYKKPGYDENDL